MTASVVGGAKKAPTGAGTTRGEIAEALAPTVASR